MGTTSKQIIFTSVGLLLLYLWLWPGWSTPVTPDWYHESDQLAPALDFTRGRVPYKDIFIAQGLIHNVLKPAASFKLFGESIPAKKLFDRILQPFGYVAIALLAAVFISNRWIWISSLLILPFLFPYFPDRHFFAPLSLAALLWANKKEPETRPFLIFTTLAGVAAGIQFWTSMELGAATLAAGLIFTLSLRAPGGGEAISFLTKNRLLRPLRGLAMTSSLTMTILFLGGTVLISLPFLIYLAWQGAIGAFIWNTTVRLFSHGQYEGIPYHPLKWAGNPFKNPIILWYLLPLVQGLGPAFLLIFRKRLSPQELREGILLSAAALFFFLPAYFHCDFEHLSFSAPYTAVLGLWLGLKFLKKIKETRALIIFFWAFIGILALYLDGVFYLHGKIPLHIRDRWDNLKTVKNIRLPMKGRLENLNLSEDEREVVRKISEVSGTSGKILNLTTEGPFNFLADKRNLCRYYLPDYIYDEKMEGEVIQNLKNEKDAVILTFKNFDETKARSKYPLPALKAAIKADFHPFWVGEKYTLWTR